MSSAPPPPPTDPPANPEKQPEGNVSSEGGAMDTTPDQPVEETWADIPEDVMALNTDDILTRIRLIENDIKVRYWLACIGVCVMSNVQYRLCDRRP